MIILLNAHKDENNFMFTSSEVLIDNGIKPEDTMDVLLGMARQYLVQDYRVELDTI